MAKNPKMDPLRAVYPPGWGVSLKVRAKPAKKPKAIASSGNQPVFAMAQHILEHLKLVMTWWTLEAAQSGWIAAIGPPKEIGKQIIIFVAFFQTMEKFAWNGSKWGQEVFVPTNPDPADILCNMDFDFENLYVLDF